MTPSPSAGRSARARLAPHPEEGRDDAAAGPQGAIEAAGDLGDAALAHPVIDRNLEDAQTLSEALRETLKPILESIEQLTAKIKAADKEIEQIAGCDIRRPNS